MSRNQRERRLRRELAAERKKVAELQSTPAPLDPSPPAATLVRHESLSVSSYSSPFPPPRVMAEYDQICPGAAQRILAIFEEQARHRMSLERIVVVGGSRRSWGGLIVGGLIAVCGLSVAGLAIHYNQPWAAGAIATAVFGAGLWAFLNGTASQAQERMQRAEALGKKKK